MFSSADAKMIEKRVRVADTSLYEEDKIWSRYSNDKVDVGEKLAKIIRTLSKALPLNKTLTALAIGSSNEPQFRLMESAFRRGLYLLDIEKEALQIVRERIKRQSTDHVKTIPGDFKKIFLSADNTKRLRPGELDGHQMNLVTLHHSMYYCHENDWMTLFANIYRYILAPKGAMHAVMMAPRSSDEHSTSHLYANFVGKYFGIHNDQDLVFFSRHLKNNRVFRNAQIALTRSRVRFWVEDFEKFMEVIWMIMLYPEVHNYTHAQKVEITEFVFRKFWKPKRHLIQVQDHLAVYRGIGFKGLI